MPLGAAKCSPPPAALTRQLERRYGDEFRSQFHFDPAALTAEAAQYLIGFRTADELRNRAATAKRQRDERLCAKGILEEVAPAAPSIDGGKSNRQFSLAAPVIENMEPVFKEPDGTVFERGVCVCWR